MTDSRLIPFSGANTGIFYAPADLTGRVINTAGLPTTFFNVTVLGSDGNYYPLGQVPADVTPVNYYINYFSPFYHSMIYRTYFGYNGTDDRAVGRDPGSRGRAGRRADRARLDAPALPGRLQDGLLLRERDRGPGQSGAATSPQISRRPRRSPRGPMAPPTRRPRCTSVAASRCSSTARTGALRRRTACQAAPRSAERA